MDGGTSNQFPCAGIRSVESFIADTPLLPGYVAAGEVSPLSSTCVDRTVSAAYSVLQRMLVQFLRLTALVTFVVALTNVSGVAGAPGNTADPESPAAPFFARHCVKCHNADKRSGDLRLDNLAV